MIKCMSCTKDKEEDATTFEITWDIYEKRFRYIFRCEQSSIYNGHTVLGSMNCYGGAIPLSDISILYSVDVLEVLKEA